MKKIAAGVGFACLWLSLAACSPGSAGSDGSDFPTRTIEYTVPFAPGGGTDLISRKLADTAEPILGQSITIINKPGASGSLGVSEVLQSAPDGYSIGLSNNQSALFTPLTTNLSYSGLDDFEPIIKLSDLPCVLVVRDDSPFETFDDFVEAAEEAPNEFTVAVAGKLTACDLSWQGQIADDVGIEVVTAPFTGGAGEAATALLGGQTDAYLGDIVGVLPQVRSGDMRALVMMQDDRHPLFEDVPSLTELGYQSTLPILYFVLGPKGMPEAAVTRLFEDFRESIESEDFQDWAAENGYLLDPIGGDDLRAELAEMRVTYEEIFDRLGQPRS